MNQRVEKVPDEDCAEFGGGGTVWEDEDGEGVCEEEEDEDEEEGDDGDHVDEGRGGVHSGLLLDDRGGGGVLNTNGLGLGICGIGRFDAQLGVQLEM